MTWDDFFAEFYDWSADVQKRNAEKLTDFGDPYEVFEVISEFAFYDKDFATRFTEKALAAGVMFLPEDVLEMTLLIEKPVLSKMAEQTSTAFSRQQLEEIYLLIDDDSFERISKRAGVDIFSDVPQAMVSPALQKKPGFFTTLFTVKAIEGLFRPRAKRHNGRCNGDCANCPPHYGYRYGQWYYGKGHTHGCEFGGNRGDGN